MVTATGQRVSKPRGGRPKSDRNDTSVKVDSALVIKAKLVAEAQGITLAEYISELIRNPVDRDFAKAARKLGLGSEGE